MLLIYGKLKLRTCSIPWYLTNHALNNELAWQRLKLVSVIQTQNDWAAPNAACFSDKHFQQRTSCHVARSVSLCCCCLCCRVWLGLIWNYDAVSIINNDCWFPHGNVLVFIYLIWPDEVMDAAEYFWLISISHTIPYFYYITSFTLYASTKLFQIYDISKCIAVSMNMLIDTINYTGRGRQIAGVTVNRVAMRFRHDITSFYSTSDTSYKKVVSPNIYISTNFSPVEIYIYTSNIRFPITLSFQKTSLKLTFL